MSKIIPNPKVKDVLELIDTLKSVEEDASKEGALDMNEVFVSGRTEQERCGTVHCVAGWYMIALMRKLSICDRREGRTCADGVRAMEHLLFPPENPLQRLHYLTDTLALWAKQNLLLWGNDSGYYMFSSLTAYNYEGFPGVIKHWEEVAQRLDTETTKEKEKENE